MSNFVILVCFHVLIITRKVSITAVAKLLQHGVNTNDSRLTEITVRGDQVLNSCKALYPTR